MPSEALWNMRESFSLKRFSILERKVQRLEKQRSFRERMRTEEEGFGGKRRVGGVYKCMGKMKVRVGLNDNFVKVWGCEAGFVCFFVLNNKYWFCIIIRGSC